MKSLFRTAVLAAATTIVTWAVRRWLDQRYARVAAPRRPPIESWENEGGALSPQLAALETSQVPR